MKKCTCCNIFKCLVSFNKNCQTKDGLLNQCKTCLAIKRKESYMLNIEKKREKARNDYKTKYGEKARERRRQYHANNKEKSAIYEKKRLINNRAYFNAKSSKRRAALLSRTPKWLNELHFQQINKIYQTALYLKEISKVSFDVDHIIPLQGKTVCGLHVPWNLQIITSTANNKKGNKIC